MPIGFYSKKLPDAQKVYSTYDRELLAAYLAVLHFKTLIDWHSESLFLDHKPIASAFYSKSVPKSDRQQCQLAFISEYVSSVEYIRGHANIVADSLSRSTCAITADAHDLTGIAHAQQEDSDINFYRDRLSQYDIAPT